MLIQHRLIVASIAMLVLMHAPAFAQMQAPQHVTITITIPRLQMMVNALESAMREQARENQALVDDLNKQVREQLKPAPKEDQR